MSPPLPEPTHEIRSPSSCITSSRRGPRLPLLEPPLLRDRDTTHDSRVALEPLGRCRCQRLSASHAPPRGGRSPPCAQQHPPQHVVDEAVVGVPASLDRAPPMRLRLAVVASQPTSAPIIRSAQMAPSSSPMRSRSASAAFASARPSAIFQSGASSSWKSILAILERASTVVACSGAAETASSSCSPARSRSPCSETARASSSARRRSRIGRRQQRQRPGEQAITAGTSPRSSAWSPPRAGVWPLARRAPRPGRRAARAPPGSGRPARGDSRGSRRARPALAVDGEPVGEALVQLGAGRLRQGLVRGVADQQVAEAERVVAGSCGCSGRRSSLRTRATSRPSTAPPSASAATAPRWKTWPSTAPRSSTSRSRPRAGRAAPPAAPGSSAGPRRLRRPRPPARPSPRRTAGCPRRPRDPLGASGRRPRRALRSARRSRPARAARAARRSHSACRRPSRAAVEQLGPRHAEQQDRRVAASRRRARPGRGTSARPSGCRRRRTTSGRSAASASSSLRNAQAISSASSAAVSSPRSEASGPVTSPSGASCLTISHRPVGDPFAVGEAAAATTVASTPARNSCASRDLPTPAAPRIVKSWHARSLTTLANAPSSSSRCRSRPTIGVERRAGRLAPARDTAGRRSPARLALQLERRAASTSTASRTSPRSPRRAGSRPAARPARAARRR